jgi:hypothetical protein
MHPFHFCVVITFDKVMEWWNTKVGGLNSRDQSRSRSRMSFVSRPTFENRRECPSCRDQLFFYWSRFLKSRLFNRDLAGSRFLSRLSRFLRFSRFVETFWDLSRLFEIYRDISTLSRPPGLNFSHHLSMIYEWTGKVRDTVT